MITLNEMVESLRCMENKLLLQLLWSKIARNTGKYRRNSGGNARRGSGDACFLGFGGEKRVLRAAVLLGREIGKSRPKGSEFEKFPCCHRK